MNSLKKNLYLLPKVRELVKIKSPTHFKHEKINDNLYSNNTISIIMTSHERSKQVYYTLKTISESIFKDVQVIIVDDSSNDILDIKILKDFKFNIDLIRVIRENKFWSNPCVNYNIGFEYIKGNKVIIQNSEVCHIGDVLSYVNNNVINNNYYVFDVRITDDFETNEKIYKDNITIEEIRNMSSMWYQHHIYRNVYYHFLTALTKSTFDLFNEFSYDYCFGSNYDDNDLLLKIISSNINIINVKNEETNIVGLHLFHGYDKNITDKRAYSSEENIQLYNKKVNYCYINKKYLEISKAKNINEIFNLFTTLNNY